MNDDQGASKTWERDTRRSTSPFVFSVICGEQVCVTVTQTAGSGQRAVSASGPLEPKCRYTVTWSVSASLFARTAGRDWAGLSAWRMLGCLLCLTYCIFSPSRAGGKRLHSTVERGEAAASQPASQPARLSFSRYGTEKAVKLTVHSDSPLCDLRPASCDLRPADLSSLRRGKVLPRVGLALVAGSVGSSHETRDPLPALPPIAIASLDCSTCVRPSVCLCWILHPRSPTDGRTNQQAASRPILYPSPVPGQD